MKRYRILFASALAVTCVGIAALQSCNKLANLVNYDLDMQTASVEVTLPPTSDTIGSAAGSQVTHYNVDSFIKANTSNALGIANISSAKMKSCTITLLNPNATNNFANFRTATGSIYSNTNTTPYLLSLSNDDSYRTVLNMPIDTSAELKDYLTGTDFTYSAGGSLRRATTDTLHVRVDFAFKVHVHG